MQNIKNVYKIGVEVEVIIIESLLIPLLNKDLSRNPESETVTKAHGWQFTAIYVERSILQKGVIFSCNYNKIA